MIKRYVDELNEIKERMEKAEKFAKKIPLFEEKILDNKYTGEESSIDFGSRYKEIPLSWGIVRNHYVSGTNVTITNYPEGEYDKYLFNIYINNVSLFNSFEEYDIAEITKKCDVYFYDSVNHHFYVEDENIEQFLEELNKWYIAVSKNLINLKIDERIKELEQELSDLKKQKSEGISNENIA